MMNLIQRTLLLITSLHLLVACSSGPASPALVPSSVLDSQESISRACLQRTVHRRGTAGFEMLTDGKEAFIARLAVVEAAQKTLDFQYFIWSDDVVGTLLADRLLAAADRGVQVRLLLDVTFRAQNEVRSAALAAHPNIEIGFFNPMTAMKGIFAGNPIPLIGEIDRMQSRMHNKLIVADNSLVIGGGRNLGDTYFGVDPHRNMRDLDYIATGPVVADSAKSFDLYWQSPLTHRGDRTKLLRKDHKHLKNLRKQISRKARRLVEVNGCPYPTTLSRTKSLEILNGIVRRMIWADYEFVSDPPERMLRQGKIASPVWRSVEGAIEGAKQEVVLHAAYLIPQENTLELFHRTTDKGVKMQMLTNSLASIDGLTAMAGIANRRGDILDTGASLYELKACAISRKTYIHAPRLTPLGMHTKGMVVDDRISFIGSYNMDPRSKYINTETGLIINSPAFAARLKAYLQEDFKAENCWHVTREPDGRFRWTSQRPGRRLSIRHQEPEVSPLRRIRFWLLTHMPWEDLL